MIIFIGDARNNKNDARGELYKKHLPKGEMCVLVKYGDRKKWDQGDSIASVYGHYARCMR